MQPATNGGPSSGSDNFRHNILPIVNMVCVRVCVCVCEDWSMTINPLNF